MRTSHAHGPLTTAVCRSASVVAGIGRWLAPIVCVYVLSAALAFAAVQAFVSDKTIAASDSPVSGEAPQHCPELVALADVDVYIMMISPNLPQLRANAATMCQPH